MCISREIGNPLKESVERINDKHGSYVHRASLRHACMLSMYVEASYCACVCVCV